MLKPINFGIMTTNFHQGARSSDINTDDGTIKRPSKISPGSKLYNRYLKKSFQKIKTTIKH